MTQLIQPPVSLAETSWLGLGPVLVRRGKLRPGPRPGRCPQILSSSSHKTERFKTAGKSEVRHTVSVLTSITHRLCDLRPVTYPLSPTLLSYKIRGIKTPLLGFESSEVGVDKSTF